MLLIAHNWVFELNQVVMKSPLRGGPTPVGANYLKLLKAINQREAAIIAGNKS